jgi:hypothetical protein
MFPQISPLCKKKNSNAVTLSAVMFGPADDRLNSNMDNLTGYFNIKRSNGTY